jgi:hypothetical protein
MKWMVPFLNTLGFKEGTTTYYGPIAVPLESVASSATPFSAEQTAQLRQQAAQQLINIGPDERERRRQAGQVMYVLSAVYIVWSTLWIDQGDLLGHLVRFVAALPLFLAVGYQRSAQEGLCNIAQKGVWDGTYLYCTVQRNYIN